MGTGQRRCHMDMGVPEGLQVGLQLCSSSKLGIGAQTLIPPWEALN